ncbi:MAG: hypothetical protein HRF45_03435 [Fimbriimonadia bacterium]|jgi:2,3-bisphosphoglycerate-independent phosphoglycerate mutase
MTPLQAAPTPHLDVLAAESEVGCAELPEGAIPSRPETSVAALLGVEPTSIPHGPLLAAATGVSPDDRDVCFRCEFVATDGDTLLGPTGPLPAQHERELISLVQEKLSTRRLHVIPNGCGPHLLIWTDGPRDLECLTPETARGLALRQARPRGHGEDVLRCFLDDCLNLLHDHPLNRARADEGMLPANLLWPYENGVVPSLRPFVFEWGLPGGLVSTAPEVRGLGYLLRMKVANSFGAETEYDGTLAASLELLSSHGFALLHIATCTAARMRGDETEVAYTLRDLDARLIAPLHEAQSANGFRLMVVGATAIGSQRHMIYLLSPGETVGPHRPFDERMALDGEFPPVAARDLMRKLLHPS